MKELQITFPTSWSPEEVMLKRKYEKYRSLKQAALLKKGQKDKMNPLKLNNTKTMHDAVKATEELKMKVKSGTLKLDARKPDRVTFKRARAGCRTSSGDLKEPKNEPEKEEPEEEGEIVDEASTGPWSNSPSLGSSTSRDYEQPCCSKNLPQDAGPSTSSAHQPSHYSYNGSISIRGCDLQEDTLKKAFAKFGNIVSCRVEANTRAAIMQFSSTADAEMAVKNVRF